MSYEKTYALLAAEISSLKKDLEITEKLMELAVTEFKKEVSKLTGLKIVEEKEKIAGDDPKPGEKTQQTSRDSENQEGGSSHEVEKTVVKSRDPNQKALFKKIASVAHPDKISSASEFEKKMKDGLFESARTAIEENDYHEICEIAERLQIDLTPPTEENIKSLRATRDRVSSKVNNLRGSYPWRWFIQDDPRIKSQIIASFVNTVRK